jgi:hypothetical protein
MRVIENRADVICNDPLLIMVVLLVILSLNTITLGRGIGRLQPIRRNVDIFACLSGGVSALEFCGS